MPRLPPIILLHYDLLSLILPPSHEGYAAVAELVDATDSKSVSGDRVGVRFPSAAPSFGIKCPKNEDLNLSK